MKNRVRAFLRAHTAPGDHVIAAVSGGKDSMTLLHLTAALAPELGLTCSAAHFNHQLRGAESDRDEEFVRQYCKAQGIPLEVGHGSVADYAKTHGLGLEEAARELRYEFLFGLRPDAWILTAHTAQDNLETVLMHLIRGAGLHGLTGIPPVRDRLLRPMLDVSRREIDGYLSRHDIPHVEDSTNALDGALRNRLRHHVLPHLEAENPEVARAVSNTCMTLRLEDDYMQSQAEAVLRSLLKDGMLDVPGLLDVHPALQYRVLAQFLSPVPELGRTHLEAALALCESGSPSARLDLPGGWALRRVYRGLALTHTERLEVPQAVLLHPGGSVRFGPWEVRWETALCPAAPPPGTLALPPQAGPLTVRSRRPGDRISLPGGTKKLSRLMIDEKVPAHLRDTLPVVCAGETILAVLPLKTAASCRLREGQDGILLSATRMED